MLVQIPVVVMIVVVMIVVVMILTITKISVVAPSTAAHKASARINRPSASVLVISVVFPLRALITSPGRSAIPEILFSAIGNKHLFVCNQGNDEGV